MRVYVQVEAFTHRIPSRSRHQPNGLRISCGDSSTARNPTFLSKEVPASCLPLLGRGGTPPAHPLHTVSNISLSPTASTECGTSGSNTRASPLAS
jgi:hypothetical protein